MSQKKELAAAVIALMVLSGSAGASGTEKLALVKVPPNAPGMIRFDSCARPVYPEQEFKEDKQGTVTLRLLVGADGRVKDSRVATSSGYPALDEAARAGISKCSFNPAMADGKAVEAWTHVQYVWTTK